MKLRFASLLKTDLVRGLVQQRDVLGPHACRNDAKRAESWGRKGVFQSP